MSDMKYLAMLDIIALNAAIMQRARQESGLRDENVLESAIMRPQMSAHYEGADLLTQAAVLIEGIARAHAFVDGNKRTALAAGMIFLDLNGFYIELDDQGLALGHQIEALVMHTITLDDFTTWLCERLRPTP
jgi:death on curing protein